MVVGIRKAVRAVFLSTLMILMGATALAPGGTADAHTQEEVMVESFDDTLIDITVCKPAGASATDPVPVILHSHGWAGSKSSCGSLEAFLQAGFGVVTISQRGHGASEGQAHVHDPDFEGQDNIAVIDHIAGLDWVEKDGQDPALGAVGGSYGGGYQLVTALTEIRENGETRLDALAPQITWHNLMNSLAPDDVTRSVWVDLLYGIGAPNVHPGIHEAFAYGVATGQVADGTVPGVYDLKTDFLGNGPNAFVDEGHLLDVPTLFRQGTTDNLFPLNEAVDNFEKALTANAQEDSLVIGYNGGHALPNVLPPGVTASGDPCTAALGYESFQDLTIAFYEAVFDGTVLPFEDAPSYMLATTDGACVGTQSVEPSQDVELDLPIVTPTMAGSPVHIEVANGPLTVAGVPTVSASVTSLGADARAFFSLSAGTSPSSAQVLSNNVMPLRELVPIVQEDTVVELAGVTADLSEDETLYLTVSPVSDLFVHHASRTPGAFLMQDVTVGVPLVE